LSFVYCPECGFQNPESANYCSKCGALLVKDEGGAETTQTYTPEEIADEEGPLDEIAAEGPALVVRSGGGRAGEHFIPQGDRTTIGRSPDNDIFLDDVTVSRKHAVVLQSGSFGSRISAASTAPSSTAGGSMRPPGSRAATKCRSANTD
jgi:hypothetical protein